MQGSRLEVEGHLGGSCNRTAQPGHLPVGVEKGIKSVTVLELKLRLGGRLRGRKESRRDYHILVFFLPGLH